MVTPMVSSWTFYNSFIFPKCTPNTSVVNCGQTASVSDMVTIDSLYELINAVSNSTNADPHIHLFFQNRLLNPKNLHGILWPNCISGQ